jgi:hypothetical protein
MTLTPIMRSRCYKRRQFYPLESNREMDFRRGFVWSLDIEPNTVTNMNLAWILT